MKIFRHNFGTRQAYVSVGTTDNAIRHLRQFLHLSDDAPLVIYGGMKMVAAGYGWFRIEAYNPTELGADLEYAIRKLDDFQLWMHKKQTSEMRCLLSYGVHGADRTDRDAQRKAFTVIQAEPSVRKTVAVIEQRQAVQQRAEAKPAGESLLTALATRLNAKFHRMA